MKRETKKETKLRESRELIEALEDLEVEKGISKEYILDSIQLAMVTAYKKNFDSAENVKIVIDPQTGNIDVYSMKEVVEIENLEDSKTQITLEDARKISKKYEVEDIVDIEIIPKDFGRIAAQTAKQVVVQKIREAERDIIYTAFNERKGEIVSGIIQKVDENMVVIDLGRLEGIMPVKEQVPSENYKVNDRIKAYVTEVQKGAKGVPQVIVSRANAEFVKKLLELEIPEIYEGFIEIKSVSRDPGSRTKVAVYSVDPNIDPVGSCVGQRGIRIQNVINELHGEKIDVIEWNEDITIFISSALAPAQVMAVDVNMEERAAQVVVPDTQLSLAIGKLGQNARLAAKLTNWKVDIKSESYIRKQIEDFENSEEIENVVNLEDYEEFEEE